ncbi:MAG TPA: DHA2 family efflux MFS transporter permease subunit [Acidimicrobiia bacterium]
MHILGSHAHPAADTAVALPGAEKPSGSKSAALVVIAVAGFFVATDITITNVALPSIGTELGASTSALQWVMDAYNIALAGLLLLGGALGERFGRKWIFLGGLTTFGIGSLLAGLSPNIGSLIGARVVMGVGAAMLLTPALSLISGLFSPAERAKAIGVWATAGAAGLAAGPILGGTLIQFLDWHWIFLVNVPFMSVVVLIGIRAIPDMRGNAGEKLDIPGAVLSVVGFTMLLGAIIEAPRYGWTNPFILVTGAVGILVLALFAMWEMHTPHPMFHFEVLRYPAVAGAALALFVTYVSFTGTLFLVPQHLDALERLDTLSVGLSLIPFAIVFWITSRISPKLAKRWGTARAIDLGLLFMLAGFVILAVTSSQRSVILVIIATCVSGIGWGFSVPLGSVVILNALPDNLTGTASGTSMLSRFLGASFGVAILGTVLSSTFSGREQDATGADSGSVQTALAAAAREPASQRESVEASIRSAFELASAETYVAGAAIVLVLGVLSAVLMSRWHEQVS